MRYADRLVMIDRSDETYNPETGEVEQGASQEVAVPCFVADLGLEKGKLIFGDYAKDRKVAYLQVPLGTPYKLCRYRDRVYKVVADKLSSTILYLEGDNSIG